MQTTIPALSYEDVDAAVEFLKRAFGFRDHSEQYRDDEGRLTHAEVEFNGGVVMLGWPGPHYRGPRKLAELSEDVRRMLDNPYVVDGVHVVVPDIEAHLAHARREGAEILRGIDDIGVGRIYTAADPEGHRWMFFQDA